MLEKNKLWKLLMMVSLMLGYGWLFKNQLISIREFGLICAIAFTATAYGEYYRRKLIKRFKQRAKDQLSKQARRFHGELWQVIHFKPLGNDELERLMNLQSEFREIHPADRYDTTNLKYVRIKGSETEDLTENADGEIYMNNNGSIAHSAT